MIKPEFNIAASPFTEDEFNNPIIDIWEAENCEQVMPQYYEYFDLNTGEVKESITPISATITVNQKRPH